MKHKYEKKSSTVFFWDWLISLNMSVSTCIGASENNITLFFMVGKFNIYILHHIFLIHSSVGEHLGLLQELIIMNSKKSKIV